MLPMDKSKITKHFPANLSLLESIIEQEVQMILALQKSHIEKRIDGVEMQSPLMPPKRKFKVKLKIRNIKRGQTTFCEDIEV